MERKSPFIVGTAALVWGLGLYWMTRIVLAGSLRDPDLWWHLASGRMMAETHTFLRTDLFSFTKTGQPWINFEWLSQLFFYAIQSRWDLPGLYVAKFFLITLSLLFLFLSIRQAGARGPFALFLLLVGFSVMQSRIACRPEIFTLIFLPLFIYLLLYSLSSMSSLKQKWMPWAFFCLTIFWVNLHAGFVYGLAVMVLSSLGLRWARYPKEQISFLDRTGALCGLAVFINPNGIHLIQIFSEHLIQLLNGPKNIISEWSATTVSQSGIFWALYFVSAIVLIAVILKRERSLSRWLPIVILFLIWGGLYVRNTALLAFIALPFLSEVGCSFFHQAKHALSPWRRSLFWILAASPLLLDARALTKSRPQYLVDPRWTPVRACEFLKANKVSENLYNTYHYGGYISWMLGPQTKIFWDGRYIFHPLMVDYLKINEQFLSNAHPTLWVEYLNRYEITTAIVEPPRFRMALPDQKAGVTDIEAMFPRADWALVFWDDAALVYLKRIPSHQQLIAAHEYQWAYPENIERLKMNIQNKQIPSQELKRELQRHTQDVGFTFLGQIQEQLLP